MTPNPKALIEAVNTAAMVADRIYGQWMPQAWIDVFIAHFEPPIAAPAPLLKEDQDDDNKEFQRGLAFVMTALAEATGAKGWQVMDGTESTEGDVRGTIMDILRCAGLYDEEDGTWATLNAPPPKDGPALDRELRSRLLSLTVAMEKSPYWQDARNIGADKTLRAALNALVAGEG